MYCWIPSHIGIYGNEKVDKNAIESLNLEVTDFTNFKPFINKYVSDNGKPYGTKGLSIS